MTAVDFMYAGADPTFRDAVAPKIRERGSRHHASKDMLRAMVERLTPGAIGKGLALAGTALVLNAAVATTGLRFHPADIFDGDHIRPPNVSDLAASGAHDPSDAATPEYWKRVGVAMRALGARPAEDPRIADPELDV